MVNIWIKIIKDNKIVKQTTVKRDENFSYGFFSDYLSEGCYALDEATPIVIKNHLFSFAKYNSVKFVPSDFVEKVDFDSMMVENLNK